MKLTFLYQPVDDLAAAVDHYRDVLGLEEAWREGEGEGEGEGTVAFWAPDRSLQIMVSTDGDPQGPMYLVDSVEAWLAEHPAAEVSVPRFAITGGEIVGLAAPGGHTYYVFDQPGG